MRVGSIVSLKKANRKLLIYGVNQLNTKNNIKYDFVACFYPEGYVDKRLNVFFNMQDIDKVYKDDDHSRVQMSQTTYSGNSFKKSLSRRRTVMDITSKVRNE